MKKVLVIPDVHGRSFWKEAKEHVHEVDEVVFLGDYVDPYDFESGAVHDAVSLIENVKEIIQFARDNAPKVTLIIGNHDAHYLSDDSNIQSSRFNSLVKNGFVRCIEDNRDLFKKCHVIDNTLFTHAGVTPGWLSYNGYMGDVDNINEVASFIEGSVIEDCAQVGISRWGGYASGGPMWADLSEHLDNTLKFNQIIGHTQLRDTGRSVDVLAQKDTSTKIICCDSRGVFMFDL